MTDPDPIYRQFQPGDRVRDKLGASWIVVRQPGCMVWVEGYHLWIHPNNLFKQD
jgi:hypothetical protein